MISDTRIRKLSSENLYWFPKIRGTFLGVLIIRIIIFWGRYWGPHILGNYLIYIICLCACIVRELSNRPRASMQSSAALGDSGFVFVLRVQGVGAWRRAF